VGQGGPGGQHEGGMTRPPAKIFRNSRSAHALPPPGRRKATECVLRSGAVTRGDPVPPSLLRQISATANFHGRAGRAAASAFTSCGHAAELALGRDGPTPDMPPRGPSAATVGGPGLKAGAEYCGGPNSAGFQLGFSLLSGSDGMLGRSTATILPSTQPDSIGPLLKPAFAAALCAAIDRGVAAPRPANEPTPSHWFNLFRLR
jgi:hypothetical protein